ncbi:hypothetical protein CLOSYM_02598 [[Clostridium] symbiosum ATCC 14940]|uniref:Uncharacterized protein n=1 Tax=[Clostridium] symbiosum ATCC 14940 TaxID=411472 RepID=A0ABC9TX14_CLOSY|nr:hypothetical protein CLOSYM_02598 [[Clostridium] symbiosum ATCC 14940]
MLLMKPLLLLFYSPRPPSILIKSYYSRMIIYETCDHNVKPVP